MRADGVWLIMGIEKRTATGRREGLAESAADGNAYSTGAEHAEIFTVRAVTLSLAA